MITNHITLSPMLFGIALLAIVPEAPAQKFFEVTTNRHGLSFSIGPGNLQKNGAAQVPRRVRQRREFPGGDQPTMRDRPEPPPLPQCAFTIDPRWKEWSSNTVFLVDEIHRVGEAGDFLEVERLQLKMSYAEIFAQYDHDRFSGEGLASKAIDYMNADRVNTVQQREAQEKFQNTDAVAKLNQHIANLDFDIKKTQQQIAPLSPNELRSLLLNKLNSNRYAYAVFEAAFAHFFPPVTRESTVIKHLIDSRESLASRATRPNTPPAVLKKALEENAKLKEIQDDLLGGRIESAQKRALAMWNSFFD